ncbi:MAG: hypothetical protein JNJ88_15970 [Planctomycetes bacterium]|nr:hypothetical protein [Planctomycetota bacterium]
MWALPIAVAFLILLTVAGVRRAKSREQGRGEHADVDTSAAAVGAIRGEPSEDPTKEHTQGDDSGAMSAEADDAGGSDGGGE